MSTPTTEATTESETPKPGPPKSAQNVSETQAATESPVQLPDDHPLVKTLAAQKDEINGLKAKVAEFEDASKTEAEKAAERLAAAERKAAEAEAAILRRDIALEHKLDKDDAALLDDMTDEDAMRRLAGRLAKQQVEDRTTRPPKPDPNQGRNGSAPTTTGDLFAATVSDLINR